MNAINMRKSWGSWQHESWGGLDALWLSWRLVVCNDEKEERPDMSAKHTSSSTSSPVRTTWLNVCVCVSVSVCVCVCVFCVCVCVCVLCVLCVLCVCVCVLCLSVSLCLCVSCVSLCVSVSLCLCGSLSLCVALPLSVCARLSLFFESSTYALKREVLSLGKGLCSFDLQVGCIRRLVNT